MNSCCGVPTVDELVAEKRDIRCLAKRCSLLALLELGVVVGENLQRMIEALHANGERRVVGQVVLDGLQQTQIDSQKEPEMGQHDHSIVAHESTYPLLDLLANTLISRAAVEDNKDNRKEQGPSHGGKDDDHAQTALV